MPSLWDWCHVIDCFLDPGSVPRSSSSVFEERQFLSCSESFSSTTYVSFFFSLSQHISPNTFLCQVNFLIRQARHLSVACEVKHRGSIFSNSQTTNLSVNSRMQWLSLRRMLTSVLLGGIREKQMVSIRWHYEMATHSSILLWKISWTEEPGRLQPKESQSQTRLSNWAHIFHFHSSSVPSWC